MRRYFLNTIVITILASLQVQAFHIMLDPGHGGIDTGAVRGNAKEADVVLKVAQQLKKILSESKQFEVSMTRTQDSNITLPERVNKAEKSKADLFVSLHANTAIDPRAKGVEFYFQNTLPPDEESLFLASHENQNFKDDSTARDEQDPSKKGDVAAILEDLHRQDRIESSLRLTRLLTQIWELENIREKVSIKQAPFYVISKTNMPSVLIEIGFITNPKEVKKLITPQYQAEVAQKIYKALVAYKEKVDKEIPVRQSAQ